MASHWYSLTSQKLFLARTLLGEVQQMDKAPLNGAGIAPAQTLRREAALQGAVELLLRARRLTLVMIARLYQERSATPTSLAELAALVEEEPSELSELRTAEQQPGSWWNHMDQLEAGQSKPPAARKTVSADNIIAVSTETGPNTSVDALIKTLSALKQFIDNLEEQHGEW